MRESAYAFLNRAHNPSPLESTASLLFPLSLLPRFLIVRRLSGLPRFLLSVIRFNFRDRLSELGTSTALIPGRTSLTSQQ